MMGCPLYSLNNAIQRGLRVSRGLVAIHADCRRKALNHYFSEIYPDTESAE